MFFFVKTSEKTWVFNTEQHRDNDEGKGNS